MKYKIYLLLFIAFGFVSYAFADEPRKHDHRHDTHPFHLGFGTAITHIFNEPGIAPGFHLHLIRQFGNELRWGIGLGYEAIADEHLHNGLNLILNLQPVNRFSVNIAPGITLGRHDGKTEILPSGHLEAIYEFDIGKIHLGPMIGYGLDRNDSHVSFGLHIGLGF
jgi:hypothetical protein